MTALDEFSLIRRFFTPDHLPAAVLLGAGDDCALLRVSSGCELAVSVDTQVVGTHFHADAKPSLIAARALRCAASDLAAMTAEPLGFTLALSLPEVCEDWLVDFSRGLLATAEALACPLIGGDTTRGPLTISVQVLGSVPAGTALRRGGAQPGDQVWVSGTLGDGAAALAMLEQRAQFDQRATQYLQERFYHPDIHFALAYSLRGVAGSCIDVSDGLLADLGHICTASGVGARIWRADLPLAPQWRGQVGAEQACAWALAGGDDYRLCFTAAPAHGAHLRGTPGLHCIGEIVTGSGVAVLDENGVPCEPPLQGFQHF